MKVIEKYWNLWTKSNKGKIFCYRYNISEVVEFIAEWRCFVLDGQVLDVHPYTDDYHAQFDPSVIDEAISCWKVTPIDYGLSVLK